jgi:hypothetical protein
MVVPAFLSDPDVVGKILRHLGLPTTAPALAPARSSGGAPGFDLPPEDAGSDAGDDDGWGDSGASEPPVRPPP